MSEFVPGNVLEQALSDAQDGTATADAFLGELVRSQIVILLDREVDPDGRWDPTINLCVLNNAAGDPVVAVFTSPERADPWQGQLPQFEYGLLVSFAWLLQGLGADLGVVVNPGWPVGVELAPEAIARLRQRLDEGSAGAPVAG